MMERTPVSVLAEQFQNGINFHQDNQATQRMMMMNRSRSPGRELDSGPSMQSHPQQHYENGLPPDASYQMMPNGYPGATYESDYGQQQQQQQQQRHRGNGPNPYTSGGSAVNPQGYNTTGSSYSVDPASRQMDYG